MRSVHAHWRSTANEDSAVLNAWQDFGFTYRYDGPSAGLAATSKNGLATLTGQPRWE